MMSFFRRLLSEQALFHLVQLSQSLWFRPVGYALAAVLALVLGPFFDPFVPEKYSALLHENAVSNVLSILASSMLAVAIFSLGTMVSAFQISAESATPRARPLVVSDRTAQSAISTFIGAFLFSILGIIGLSVRAFSDGGRLVLMGLAILLVVVVLTTLIVWMQRLTQIGGVTEVIDQVENAAEKSFGVLANAPCFEGRMVSAAPEGGDPVYAAEIGHVQHIDAEILGRLAEKFDTDIYLFIRAGQWVNAETPVCQVYRPLKAAQRAELCKAFVIGDQRTFEADPTYALVVLSEIAERALSPAVNDTGTALNCLKTATRILVKWRNAAVAAKPTQKHMRLLVPAVDCDAYLEAGFARILRGGAGNLEVGQVMRMCLALLQKTDPGSFDGTVKDMDQRLLNRAKLVMDFEDDYAALVAAEGVVQS